MLQAELNRTEDLLSASRAERDEIGIKYNALSERVSEKKIYFVVRAVPFKSVGGRRNGRYFEGGEGPNSELIFPIRLH